MLEIVILFLLGRNIASIARNKNRGPVGYVLLLVFGWFGLGIGLGVVAAVIGMAGGMNEDDALLPFVGGYIVGAACAAGLAYLVVGAVSKLPRRAEYDDDDAEYDDYDDRPRRRRRDEAPYDYEDDRPRRRRHEDDENDYDRPRRRRDDY